MTEKLPPHRSRRRASEAPRAVAWKRLKTACALGVLGWLAAQPGPLDSDEPPLIKADRTASFEAGVERLAKRAAEPPAAAEPSEVVADHQPAASEPTIDPWLNKRLTPVRWRYGDVLAHPERHRVQILVTRVRPDKDGSLRITEHGYRADAEYFYPASAIKPFVAVGALRKLQRLAETQPVDLDTPLRYCEIDGSECLTARDSSNLQGRHITLGHELRKMLLVSSNRGFNRLYDFVGHEELNRDLQAIGFAHTRVHHRMMGGIAGGLASPRIELMTPSGVHTIPRRTSGLSLGDNPARGLFVGHAHFDDKLKLIERPADFSRKNYASLRDLHRLLIGLVRPDLPGAPDLGLSPRHRSFIVDAMREEPLLSQNPVYVDRQFAGARYKVMLRGMRKVMPVSLLRYVNKSGRAYGFEIENAYAENVRTGDALFISAVIYANPNGVINDNGYAYEGITGPFLELVGANLASAVLFK